MTFQVGDTVRYRKNQDKYIGVVRRIDDSGIHYVDWKMLVGKDDWTEIGAASYTEDALVIDTEVPSGASTKIAADGGPAAYYDLPGNWTTLNDLIEYKSLHQWKEHSFHWGNVVKALTRWGDKDGTTKEYDAKKVIYSGCRVLKAIIGVENLRTYLQKLLDDPQFQSKGN